MNYHMTMNYTKGEWKVTDTRLETLTTGDSIRIGCINGELDQHIAFTSGRTVVENTANAQLIVSTVNACASVNSDNPLAVAESIKDMYEALKEACTIIHNQIRYEKDAYRAMLQRKEVEFVAILAKAEGKETI